MVKLNTVQPDTVTSNVKPTSTEPQRSRTGEAKRPAASAVSSQSAALALVASCTTEPLGTGLRGYISLIACLLTIAFVWSFVLPRIGKIPAVEAHIQAMEKADINVGAMFYSELNWESPTGAAWR